MAKVAATLATPTPRPRITWPTVWRPNSTRDQATATAARMEGTARTGTKMVSRVAHTAAVVAWALTLYQKLMTPSARLATTEATAVLTATAGAPSHLKATASRMSPARPKG